MGENIEYKEAIRDIRHALAECNPEQHQKWMNATPQKIAETVIPLIRNSYLIWCPCCQEFVPEKQDKESDTFKKVCVVCGTKTYPAYGS